MRLKENIPLRGRNPKSLPRNNLPGIFRGYFFVAKKSLNLLFVLRLNLTSKSGLVLTFRTGSLLAVSCFLKF